MRLGRGAALRFFPIPKRTTPPPSGEGDGETSFTVVLVRVCGVVSTFSADCDGSSIVCVMNERE